MQYQLYVPKYSIGKHLVHGERAEWTARGLLSLHCVRLSLVCMLALAVFT